MPRRKGKVSGDARKQGKTRRREGGGEKSPTNDVASSDIWYQTKGRKGSGASSLSSEDRVGFAVLAVATTAAYAPVFDAGFLWDDSIFAESALVQSWGGIFDFWFRPSRLDNEVHFWPVVYSSFWLEYRIWGSNPLGYHVINLILHIVNACLVKRLLRKVGASAEAAWLAALIFALHPTRVESVAWVIERKDVLSGLFYLLSLLYHPSIGYEGDKTNKATQRALWTSLGLYALGMLSKSIVVSLPVMLLVVPWTVRGTVSATEAQRSVPFFLVGIAMALFDMSMARAGEPVDFGFNLVQRVLIASRALCFYLAKLVWPSERMVIYPLWDLEEDRAIWATCFLSVATASLAALYAIVCPGDPNRLAPRVLAGALVFFGATLFPVLCILDYGYMKFSFVADRFAYLAGIAPIALFAVGFARGLGRLPARRRGIVLHVVAGVLLAVLASLTYRQASIYRTEEAFFTHITSLNPRARSMWTNLGNVYMRQERYAEAVESYEQELKWNSSPDKLYTNYAIVLRKMGRTDEAVEMLRRGLEQPASQVHSRDRKKALNEMGNAMSELKRYEEAAMYFRQALELEPNYAIGWHNLANDLFRAGKVEESMEAFGRAIAINPNYIKARLNYAVTLGMSKRHDEQIEQLREVLRREPGNKIAKERLDVVLAKVG